MGEEQKKESLCHLLNRLVDETSGETVTVGDLLRVVGARSFGPLIMLLGFIWISPLTIVPGATWAVALLTLLITGQIVFGRTEPWVPGRLLGFEFKREHLLAGTKGMRYWAEIFDEVLEPRLTFLTEKPFLQLIALVCVAAALITFPLGLVPFGPVLPGLAVLMFGLGLAARDGGMIILACASLAGAGIVLVRFASNFL